MFLQKRKNGIWELDLHWGTWDALHCRISIVTVAPGKCRAQIHWGAGVTITSLGLLVDHPSAPLTLGLKPQGGPPPLLWRLVRGFPSRIPELIPHPSLPLPSPTAGSIPGPLRPGQYPRPSCSSPANSAPGAQPLIASWSFLVCYLVPRT